MGGTEFPFEFLHMEVVNMLHKMEEEEKEMLVSDTKLRPQKYSFEKVVFVREI